MNFDELSTTYPGGFPHKKQLGGNELAYIVPLSLGRSRINVTTLNDLFYVHDCY